MNLHEKNKLVAEAAQEVIRSWNNLYAALATEVMPQAPTAGSGKGPGTSPPAPLEGTVPDLTGAHWVLPGQAQPASRPTITKVGRVWKDSHACHVGPETWEFSDGSKFCGAPVGTFSEDSLILGHFTFSDLARECVLKNPREGDRFRFEESEREIRLHDGQLRVFGNGNVKDYLQTRLPEDYLDDYDASDFQPIAPAAAAEDPLPIPDNDGVTPKPAAADSQPRPLAFSEIPEVLRKNPDGDTDVIPEPVMIPRRLAIRLLMQAYTERVIGSESLHTICSWFDPTQPSRCRLPIASLKGTAGVPAAGEIKKERQHLITLIERCCFYASIAPVSDHTKKLFALEDARVAKEREASRSRHAALQDEKGLLEQKIASLNAEIGSETRYEDAAKELAELENTPYEKFYPDRDGRFWRTRACMAEAAWVLLQQKLAATEKERDILQSRIDTELMYEGKVTRTWHNQYLTACGEREAAREELKSLSRQFEAWRVTFFEHEEKLKRAEKDLSDSVAKAGLVENKPPEPPHHVCGLQGYNGMIDSPCPACEAQNSPTHPLPKDGGGK